MNPKVKLGLYVVLLVCMAVCGSGLYATYHGVDSVPVTPSTNVVSGTNRVLTAPPATGTNQAVQIGRAHV